MREPLAALGDAALVYVGDLCLRGETPLRAKAPKLIDWLGAEAAREQARRRRGEAVEPAPDLDLGGMTAEELLGAGEAAAFMTLAVRRVGFDRDGTSDLEETHAILETLGLWTAITEAVRRQLGLTEALEAAPATMH